MATPINQVNEAALQHKDEPESVSFHSGPRASSDVDPEKKVGEGSRIEEDGSTREEESGCANGGDAAAPDKSGGGLTAVLSRVVSRVSIKSNLGPPPDGGTKAWITVACAHLIMMNTWGFINSFGVFQTYYASALSRPPSDISWVGSIQIFLLFFIGTISGRITDAGYFRLILLLGSVFQIIGIFTAAQATQYWQVFLSQGICMGVGNGFLFCPTMAVLSTYFDKKRSLAIGIAASGAATGGLVFPSMARELLPRAGFAWTMRAIGFIQMATLVVGNSFLRPRIPPRKSGVWVEWAAFRELEYTFYAAGSFLCFLGLYFPFYYIASFCRDIIGMPYTESLNLLLILNGSGAIGRIGLNYVADKVGTMTVFVPIALSCSICVFSWMAVTTQAGAYIWVVFYGIAAGGIQSLFPAGLSSLTTDLRKAGVRMGMVFTIQSFAVLSGPPIAGALISSMNGRYYGAQGFAGAVLFLGMCMMAAARIVKARKLGGGLKTKV